MICQTCNDDVIEQNTQGVWIHEDPEQDEAHDARPTIREYDAEEQFEDLLNENYEPVNVCGYDYDAGRALRLLDPIAFRQEMLNYFDGEGIEID